MAVNSQSLYQQLEPLPNYISGPPHHLEDAPHYLPPPPPSYVTNHEVSLTPEHEYGGPYHAPPPPPKSYGPPPQRSSECALVVPSKRAAGPPLKPLSPGLRYINNYIAGYVLINLLLINLL